MMKILILSTFEKTGGAAIAASRLLCALNRNGADARMLCRRNISWGPKVLRKQSWTSIFERLAIWIANGFSAKDLWATDIALLGQDITTTREFAEADVIHLHWVNQGFLSLDIIDRIVASGKRIVWTMHDEWPLESVWHYT
ncbi:MAG: glycosyl transferase, partial [Prevotella sp.]|nr:glycosyl transferase [Prevotella sp.]